MNGSYPMTQEGYDQLKMELKYLTSNERPEVINAGSVGFMIPDQNFEGNVNLLKHIDAAIGSVKDPIKSSYYLSSFK